MAEPFERRRLRVYVAGPITKGDRLDNVHRAMTLGKRMLADGLAPYIPHLDAYLMLDEATSWNAFLEWDLEWVAQSEAVYRIAGESRGADLECEVAESLGVPVFRERTWQPVPRFLHYGEPRLSAYGELLAFARERGLDGVRK